MHDLRVVPEQKVVSIRRRGRGGVVKCLSLMLLIVDLFVVASSAAVTPIPSASWHDFVAECLAEAPVTGECTTWASANNYGTMPNWDVSLVTDMSGGSAVSSWIAQGLGSKTTFNGNISSWNTAQVTNMFKMFNSNFAFNQDIGNWNTAQVTNMDSMFNNARVFNHSIGNWNTAQVTNMKFMFYNAAAFNQDVGS